MCDMFSVNRYTFYHGHDEILYIFNKGERFYLKYHLDPLTHTRIICSVSASIIYIPQCKLQVKYDAASHSVINDMLQCPFLK